MTYVTKRSDSSFFQFRVRVPQSAVDRVKGRHVSILFPAFRNDPALAVTVKIGTEVKFSLQTKDEVVAKSRDGIARTHLQKVFNAAESGPKELTYKQVVALSGEVYRKYVEIFEDDPGDPDEWAAHKAINRAAIQGRIATAPPINLGEVTDREVAASLFGNNLTAGINALPASDSKDALEQRFGSLADWVLALHGIEINCATREVLLAQVGAAVTDASWRLKRNAKGDYSPDPIAERFPAFSIETRTTLSELFKRWQNETQPAPSTVTTWKTVIRSLSEHLKHEDIKRIRSADVIAWKDRLVASGKTAKTINDSYLAALNALLNYGVSNGLLLANPAAGVKVQARRRAGTSMLPYDDEEVARLLHLAKQEKSASRRWLPWLAALSGARIGELAQLWGSRIKSVQGVVIMEIRPAEDGGSLKNEGSERRVPIHPVLIADGFVDFVRSKGEGPLFYKRRVTERSPTRRHASKGVSNHLAEWIRSQGFQDERKSPNHALRHWWKSAAARAGIQDSVADAIQGHAARSDAATYRHFELSTLRDAISTIAPPILTDLE